MIDPTVCPGCGEADRALTLAPVPHSALRCGRCGADRPFLRLPLLCLTGPSGAGKSTVAAAVVQRLDPRVVTVEQDVLWEPRLVEEPDGVRAFRARWLRLAAMIHQNGRPVLLCGTVVPEELEPLPERSLFSAIHYLTLDAPDDVLMARLRTRPAWRGWDEPRIEEMVRFAGELRRRSAAPHELGASVASGRWQRLDSEGLGVDEVADAVARWALSLLARPG